jgi:hypothetical protein
MMVEEAPAMARRPKDVRGIKFRPDRGTWEGVRKNFLDRDAAVVWLETAKD